MLHVRLVSPPDLTGRLVATLEAESRVVNLVLLPGAARRPEGDLVQFEVPADAANLVLRRLRDLGFPRHGAVLVENVDAALEDDGSKEVGPRGRVRELEPVWELVEAAVRAGATYPPSFFLLLVIAGLIAAVGILTNSQILIVGAMVVGPEYGAIMAAALGITKRDWRSVARALLVLCVGFLAAIVTTLAFSVAVRLWIPVPEAFSLGLRPVSSLINSPNAFSIIVAVLAGVAGVVSMTESRANALIGVFISVTMIPAAADIAVSLAFQSWSEAEGSAVQLVLNVVVLIVVGAVVLILQRRFWRSRGSPTAGPVTRAWNTSEDQL